MREFDSTGRKERLPSGQIAAQPFLTQLLQVQLANLVRRKGTSPSYLQGKSRLHLESCVRYRIMRKREIYLSFSLDQSSKVRKVHCDGISTRTSDIRHKRGRLLCASGVVRRESCYLDHCVGHRDLRRRALMWMVMKRRTSLRIVISLSGVDQCPLYLLVFGYLSLLKFADLFSPLNLLVSVRVP